MMVSIQVLAPRSTWEPSRAPSLSPRNTLPIPEFRTYSPDTPAPHTARPKVSTKKTDTRRGEKERGGGEKE